MTLSRVTDTRPTLRFSEFKGDWKPKVVKSFVVEKKNPPILNTPLYSLTIENGITEKSARYERSFLVKDKEDAYKSMDCDDFAFNPMNLRFGALARHKKTFKVKVSKYYDIFGVDSTVSIEFVEHILKTSRSMKFYNRMATGSLEEKKRVHFSDFLLFEFPFPTLDEQNKISNFLSFIDRKQEYLSKKLKLLKSYKRGVVQKIFSQEIRFKKEDGASFPDWEAKSLNEILSYEQPTKYLVNSTEYDNAYNVPVLTAGKTFILGYTNEIDNQYDNLPVIIFDDFTTATKYVDFPFKIKSSAMKLLKCKNPEVNTRVIFEFIQKLKFPIGEHKRYWISEYQWQVLPLPCIEEQEKIAAFLSTFDKKIETVGRQLTEVENFKKGLLQQMFV